MRKIQYWKKKILDMIYPPRCPVCHGIVESGYDMICPQCVPLLPLNCGYHCPKCGKPVEHANEYCHDCSEVFHKYDQGIGVFLYDDVMRTSIHRFKYLGRKEYGRFYGIAAWKYQQEQLCSWKPEVIVPVPVHKSRKAERGYNQAQVIADVLAEQMGISVASGVVIRCKKTYPQKDLSPEERQKNLEEAFEKGKAPLLWKRVLLVDDIYTTGSTADAVSKILRLCGAEEIYVLSICIGKGFMV